VLVVVLLAVAAILWLVIKPGKDSGENAVAPPMRGIVVLAVDVSRSVAATDVSPSRLEAVTSGVTRFADRLNPGLLLGLVIHAETATLEVAPTTNHHATAQALRRVQSADRTATGEGIVTSLRAIATLGSALGDGLGPPPARIVLLSDGPETVPSNPDGPEGAFSTARTAKGQGVPISTISVGTQAGYVEINDQRQPTPVDDSMPREIAGIAGGSSCSAATIEELNDAFDAVVKQIG
jgi:Ca-activated chloride channel family protein